jgi:hypothetical protein
VGTWPPHDHAQYKQGLRFKPYIYIYNRTHTTMVTCHIYNRAHTTMVTQHIYITVGLNAHNNDHMPYIYNRGPGLSPGPVRTPFHIISNSNEFKHIYIYIYIYIYMLSTTCGHAGWAALPKALP